MSIDMSQFHQVFFEESFEGLEAMESGLLGLEPGTPDIEAINTIFRAAHSIKGGAGTFGFMHITDFTHVMETILDEMRDGKREVTPPAVTLLLESVDCLRQMLVASQEDSDYDKDRATLLNQQLQALLSGDAGTILVDKEISESSPDASQQPAGWHISFAPHAYMLRTGNDPLRMFRELAGFGDISSTVSLDRLPDLDQGNPEEVYLAWELRLDSDCSREQIAEVFSWVEDDCELSIEPLTRAEADEKHGQATESGSGQQEDSSITGDTVSEPSQAAEQDTPGKASEKSEVNKNGAGSQPKATSIRVDVSKIDSLINLVGEMVITQSMLSQYGRAEELQEGYIEKLQLGLTQLESGVRELQEAVMGIRMMPISFSFSRFPRLVHDLSSKMNKQVALKMSGENTELDKTVMEKIGDPMVHLVRNSLDHGLETPETRRANGKEPTGTLHLNAYHEGGKIVIEISDDGAGLNTEKILAKAWEKGIVEEGVRPQEHEIHRLIFAPGFSTADVVSDISGRGVGMDVVIRNIRDLGGSVDVMSEQGKGSTFTIRLPLTLAILDGQLATVGEQTFIIPLISIVESLQMHPDDINRVSGNIEVYKLREEYIPIIRLGRIMRIEDAEQSLEKGLLVITEVDGSKVGIFVDSLQAQQQVVIKSLETNYRKIEGISGATILGDGNVALILDLAGIVSMSQNSKGRNEVAA